MAFILLWHVFTLHPPLVCVCVCVQVLLLLERVYIPLPLVPSLWIVSHAKGQNHQSHNVLITVHLAHITVWIVMVMLESFVQVHTSHTYTHTHTHTQTQTQTHTHTQIQTHMRTHTNTNTSTARVKLCDNGDIRLVDGGTLLEGRVEMCYNSRWGTVCDTVWDNRDASVVCKQVAAKYGLEYTDFISEHMK